ncbi:unnamed protein product [Cylindrotheca closterium]|uniref:PAS domain-containing protein n=1 Tax=Cylindrotheca closterium TaxID=2856 RepID=A0AAD2FLZ6_9STRA|nr:unnamed protein product [Cylindrotheca closterium]
MNTTSLRSKQTQNFVKKSLRAISSTTKAASTLPSNGSLMSWNDGNIQNAVGSTRKVSVASANAGSDDGDDNFPMKLSHFIQRRRTEQQVDEHHHYYSQQAHQQTQTLQEKWSKLASLTMDPSIGDLAKAFHVESSQESSLSALPQTLTEAMSDSRPCMISSVDDPFKIVNVNQAWCHAYGYSKDKVLNQNMVKLLGNSQALEDFVSEQLMWNESTSTKATKMPPATMHYSRDGTPVNEPLRVGTLSIGADVSDRYIVCVTEMESTFDNASSFSIPPPTPATQKNQNQMVTCLEDYHLQQGWFGQAGLA